LRAEGIHHSELIEQGIAFAVRSMEIDFPRAAHIDDQLVVDTAVLEVSGARLTLDQSIERGDELIARAKVVVVAIKGGRAARLPSAVVAAFGRGR
jgi:acyl-CoA thioester hydrolase